MDDTKNNIKYVLTIEFDPNTEKIQVIHEEISEVEPEPILFKGNVAILDYIDDESLAKIIAFEIAES